MFAAPSGTTLEAIVGRGSVFEVAVVLEQGKRFIAKRPRPELRDDAAGSRALSREAAVLAKLGDPRVPGLIRVGSDAAGPFLVETLVEGPSLRALTDLAAPLPLPARASLARRAVDVVSTLQALEDSEGPLGFVHGDLSPDHFVLTSVDDLDTVEVGLLDFGSACARGTPELEPGARGTLPFTAPELCRGDTSPSMATDRYALAVVLGQFLARRRLCQTSTAPAMLVAIGENGHDVEALGELPIPVQNALARHLAFRSEDRPDDLDELARALEAPSALG